jgi:hypothetical protein
MTCRSTLGTSKRKPPIARNDRLMGETLRVGDRVKVYMGSKFWRSEGWFEGTIARIDPYSEHRSFYWVKLDVPIQTAQGSPTDLVSVLNLKNIERTS